MSQWTHVAGCIRIDALPFQHTESEQLINEKFGKCCSFDDPESVWDACTVPCGSEGSLQYKLIRNDDEDSLVFGSLLIWGDLRDYADYQAIYEWVKQGCEGLFIRSCSVKIDVEFANSYIVYNRWDAGDTVDGIEIVLLELKKGE